MFVGFIRGNKCCELDNKDIFSFLFIAFYSYSLLEQSCGYCFITLRTNSFFVDVVVAMVKQEGCLSLALDHAREVGSYVGLIPCDYSRVIVQ